MTGKKGRRLCTPSPDDLVVKIEYIADQFGLTADEFDRYRHLGLISTCVELGLNDEAGLNHVKCHLGNRVWEAVVDHEGTIVYEATRFLRGKLASRDKIT